MRDTNLRNIGAEERNILHILMEEEEGLTESGYRTKIILLKDDGYANLQIRRATNRHDVNIRKWIHRFNEKGIDGITSKTQA